MNTGEQPQNNILYKSSTFQTYFYFLIYPFIAFVSIFVIYKMLLYGSFGLFVIIMIIGFTYTFISSMESLYALRYVKVLEDCILVKTINGYKKVEYKNIIYVYNLVNVKGIYVIVWYKDIETNKNKVILIRPEKEISLIKQSYMSNLLGKGEIEMTKFIKEKAIKENKEYLMINNPRWFLFIISPNFLN